MSNSFNYPYQQMPANYSGVTINITNPSLNSIPMQCQQPAINYQTQPTPNYIQNPVVQPQVQKEAEVQPQSYPPQYYLNNYNYQALPAQTQGVQNPIQNTTPNNIVVPETNTEIVNDMQTSNEIINDLNSKAEEQKDLEKNGKKQRVVNLTNEYIQSLENYLNNPNQEIRLMAAKEVLTRLDEDKARYDDAALNALINKMLQDPDKLVRIAAMSALSAQLASGNDYTVKLLKEIQANPNSNKEDVLEASNILLNLSASSEIRYVPQKQPVPNVQQPEKQYGQLQVEQVG